MVELNEKAFTQYRRKQIAELRPWREGDDMAGISVSREDVRAGSPKPGDMIARNPKNHADQWLVAAAYFADNFEPASALPEEVVFCPQCGWNSAMDGEALPAPDDGLVERLRYRVDNPSAWDSFDQGGSDLCREAATALDAAQKALAERDAIYQSAVKGRSEFRKAYRDAKSRAEAAEQQVQKLTADIKRLREAVKQIERRTAPHDDDTPADDKRDKMHAHALACGALHDAL